MTNTEQPYGGIRHGENLIVPVSVLPPVAREQHTSYIVGHSETGHHHVLESETPFDVMVDQGVTFLELYANADIVHQKASEAHNTLTLPAGSYVVHRKREYFPQIQQLRPVID